MCDSPSLSERLADPTSVLLLAPALEAPDNHVCIDLLTPVHPHEANVLSITVSATPDERLALWQRQVGDTLPNRATIVDAGGATTAADGRAAADAAPSITVDHVSDPANPHELGVAIGQALGPWEATSERTLVCLHSLTALLETLDRAAVRQLITALNARFAPMDVVAHYHLDPTAHDDQVIAALRPVFDTVVEHDPAEAWAVRTAAADEAVPRYQRDRAADKRARSGATGPPAVAQPPLPYSFQTVLELLSARVRRYALYAIVDQPGDGLSLETIVDRVAQRAASHPGRPPSRSRAELTTALVHSHLPRLDEAGIITFDPSAQSVSYRPNPGLEACVNHARAIEQQ